MSAPLRLGLVGAAGRMGRRLDILATEADDLVVTARVDAETGGLAEVEPASVDCIIDFSAPAQVGATCDWVAAHKKLLVMGTTGLEQRHREALSLAARRSAVLWAPNFSVGVNVLFELVSEAARMLGAGVDFEVFESHHRRKVDAPSGTARRLVELLAARRGSDYQSVVQAGRDGQVGARSAAEIGVHAARGGDVVGTHTVYGYGLGEQLELTHRATDRDIFAHGALRAARWLALSKAAPGLYSMSDVLGR